MIVLFTIQTVLVNVPSDGFQLCFSQAKACEGKRMDSQSKIEVLLPEEMKHVQIKITQC